MMSSSDKFGNQSEKLGFAGYYINVVTENPVLAYCNGKLLSLRDAFSEGFITREEAYNIGTLIDPSFEHRYPDPKASFTQDTTKITLDSTTILKNDIPDADLSVFSEMIASEGYEFGLSRGDFLKVLGKYSHEGKKITALVPAAYINNTSNEGCFAASNNYTYQSTIFTDKSFATYTNAFTAYQSTDGLVLPFGLEFGDSYTEAAQKMNLDIDPLSLFSYDDRELSETITLYKTPSTSFEIYRLNRDFNPPISYQYKYIYAEKVSALTTRTVTFGFSSEGDHPLSFFNVIIAEDYEPRKVIFNDTSAFARTFAPTSDYRQGQKVTLKLDTVTEQYYRVFVNGEEIQMSSSDLEYTYFTFTIPATDVYVEIETVSVTIPEGK